MIAAARSGAGVDGGRPRRGMPRVVGERRDGLAEALVARPAKDHGPVLPGRAGDGGGPGLSGQLFGGGEAGAVIAEFGEELGRIDLPTARQALEERAVGMVGQGGGDARPRVAGSGRRGGRGPRPAADEFATGVALRLARAADGGAAQAGPSSSAAGAAPAVGVAAEELGQAALAHALGALGRGVAGQEGQGDRGIDVGKDHGGAGPEALEQGAELIGEGHPLADEVIAAADQGAQGPGLVGERAQGPEAMAIGAEQVGQEIAVAVIALGVRRRSSGRGWP